MKAIKLINKKKEKMMNKIIEAIIDNVKINKLNIDDILENPENEIDCYYYAIRGIFATNEIEKDYLDAFLSVNNDDIEDLIKELEWIKNNI